jgi:hypothetical protein
MTTRKNAIGRRHVLTGAAGLTAAALLAPQPAWAQPAGARSRAIGANAAARVKLLARRARRAAPQDRQFLYIAAVAECEPPTKRYYFLAGNAGNYVEDFCDAIYNGQLTFVESRPLPIESGQPLQGFRYNGVDNAGEYGYFFGSDDLGNGQYALVMLAGHFQPGQDPEPFPAEFVTLASRRPFPEASG